MKLINCVFPELHTSASEQVFSIGSSELMALMYASVLGISQYRRNTAYWSSTSTLLLYYTTAACIMMYLHSFCFIIIHHVNSRVWLI